MSHPLTSQRPAMVGIGAALGVAFAMLVLGVCVLLGDPFPGAEGNAAAPGVAGAPDEVSPPMREPLIAHLARNPRDGRGWVLFARIEFDGDRFAAAAEAYRKALDASHKVARDPGVWCEYADALAMAQGGVLAGRPRELVERALALDPRHARALEMAGSAAFEAGDFSATVRNWRQLLAQLPDGTREHRDLAIAIREAEQRDDASAPSRVDALR